MAKEELKLWGYLEQWISCFKYEVKISLIGPIVRITPGRVHLSDPENYDKIYNMTSRFYKDPNFYGAPGINYAAFATIPNDLYRVRRSTLNPSLSRKTVLEPEAVVQSKVPTLCRRMQATFDAKASINLHSRLRAVGLDVITDYALDKCWNRLKKISMRSLRKC